MLFEISPKFKSADVVHLQQGGGVTRQRREIGMESARTRLGGRRTTAGAIGTVETCGTPRNPPNHCRSNGALV